MRKVRLILVGGFLGSGKTTLLYRSALSLIKRGKRVGIVTNDQAPGSVDTRLFEHHGLSVREVGGRCFCCNFQGLLRNAGKLRRDLRADVILLEPVGSCTDLSATVLQPLKERFRREFLPSPLSVLADPHRLRRILTGSGRATRRGPDYIFLKQLEEADLILIGKADLLDRDDRRSLRRLVAESFPGIPARTVSPLSGAGISGWLDTMLAGIGAGKRIAEVDYDVYAEGEAALGWLNADLSLATTGCCIIDWRMLCLLVMREMKSAFEARRAAVGHVKILITDNGKMCSANLTRLGGPIDLHGVLGEGPERIRMTVNARVEMDPKQLERVLFKALESVTRNRLRMVVHKVNAFRPARPKPTFRYAGSV